jgi:peptide/nickel transport system permease protein
MLHYIVVRLVHSLFVIVLITLAVFGILHLAPGDPVLLLVGEEPMTAEQLDAMRRHWGLDRPVHLQYATWLANLFRGDFGQSIGFGGRPVSQLLLATVPNTVQLNVLALALALVVAIPAGVLSAVKRYSAPHSPYRKSKS